MNFLSTNAIVKSTIGLFAVSMVLKIAGYGEKLVLAYYFGTSDDADAYILVLAILLSFFFLFREVVEPGVMNVFMRSDETEAWGIFNYVLRVLFFITAGIVV